MTQALYRKWRPQTWDDVVGQEHIIQTLKNAIQSGRTGHAYLFAGPRGTGKTSTARLLAKAVNCLDENEANHPCNKCELCEAVNRGQLLDLIEIDAASNTSVDDVRDLRDKINFSPSQGRYKIYIIDEVHMLSTAAFNALLKTLEEPPPHAIFVLATTEIHKIPATVLSRCQRHEFRRISLDNIVSHLNDIVKDEGVNIDPAAVQLIARQSTGALRDAISLLDQLSSTGEKITLDTAQHVLGTATSQAVLDIIDSLVTGSTVEGINAIHVMLDGGADPRQFARQIVEYFRLLLLFVMGKSSSGEQTSDMLAQIEKHAQQLSLEELLFCLRRFNMVAADTRGNWQPNLPLELAFAECVEQKLAQKTAPLVEEVSEQRRTLPPPISRRSLKDTFDAEKSHTGDRKSTKISKEESVDQVEITSPQVLMEPESDELSSQIEEKPAVLGLSVIRQHWDKIRQEVRSKSLPTEALLNSCKSIGVKNGELILGFASDLVKSKMDTKENLALVRQVMLIVLNAEVPIRCIVVSKNIESSVEESLEGDGMVNAALNLGGQIVQKE